MQVIGPRPQGLWMGLLTAVGSLARIVSPIVVSEIYKEFGTYWTFDLCAGSIGLAMVVTLATYGRLVSLETRMARQVGRKYNSKQTRTLLSKATLS